VVNGCAIWNARFDYAAAFDDGCRDSGIYRRRFNQLQAVLDRRRMDVYRERMTPMEEYSNGTALYHNYYFCESDVERQESGTAAWRVENSAGSVIGTANYTANYDSKHIRFTADQAGSAYWISYRAFDIERAAADVWEQKASNVAARFDIKTDNHDLKRSQLRASYLQMAQLHKKRAKPQSTRMTREDVW
jgi:hypothetical protein